MSYSRHNQPTKYDQEASTNIDMDLKISRTSKYEKNQLEVKQYLYDIITPTYPDLFTKKFSIGNANGLSTIDLMEMLKDGEVLCKLGSLIPIPNNPTSKFKNSRMAFIQMENISFFLKLCELVGVSHDEIFQTVDLYELKDPYQVIITLMSLSRIVNSIDSNVFKYVIGPKPPKVKPNVPTKPLSLKTQ